MQFMGAFIDPALPGRNVHAYRHNTDFACEHPVPDKSGVVNYFCAHLRNLKWTTFRQLRSKHLNDHCGPVRAATLRTADRRV